MDPIYLTFDDGPDVRFTPALLDLLANHGALATFFVVGEAARAQPRIMRRIVDEGHEIGNHTMNHRHPWLISERQAVDQVRAGARAIADVTGVAPRYFRPPYGARRTSMLREAASLGEALVMWDVSLIDWGPLGSAASVMRRATRVASRQIVLMHDGKRGINRPEVLLHTVPRLLERFRSLSLRARTEAGRHGDS